MYNQENENEDSDYEKNNELIREVSQDEDLNFSMESTEQNPCKYIDNDQDFDKTEENDNNNLINEFNTRQFKSNLYTFESNLTNFKFYKKTENLLKENKVLINQDSQLLFKKENFERLNKKIIFEKLYPNNKEEEEVKPNSDFDSKKEERICKDKMSYDFKTFYPYLEEQDYYNYIFMFLIIKYHNDPDTLVYIDYKEVYLYEKNLVGKEFTEMKNEIKLLNEKIYEKRADIKLLDNKIYIEGTYSDVLKKLREVGNIYNNFNIYLLNFINLVHKNPLYVEVKIYKLWKLYLGKILSIWDYKDKAGIIDKTNIKYLVAKKLIQKLFNDKEKGNYLNYKLSKRESKSNFANFDLVSSDGEIPRLSFPPNSRFTLIYNLIFDLFLSITFITLPIIYILNIDSIYFNTLNLLTSGIYFFYIIKSFRDLTLDNMSNLEKDLYTIFLKIISDFWLILDFVSMIPFDIINSDGSPDYPISTYLNMKFVFLLRYQRMGKSKDFFEKTKYATQFRLGVLMGKFILMAQWMGLFFVKYFDKDISNKSFNRSPECITTSTLNYGIDSTCLFVDALYIGGYILPGKSLQYPNLPDQKKTTFQYFYIFFAFFIGQIITATVFSNVSDIINSMNESENKYKEIKDNHRLIEHFYKIDEDTSKLVQNYYRYLWLKHKEDIYGLSLFHNLSKQMQNSFNVAMIPGIEYMIKDFMNLSNTDNKFISYVVSKLKKYVAIPYERVISQGQVIKGLFFLYNGKLFSLDEPKLNNVKYSYNVNFSAKDVNFERKETKIRPNEKRLDLEGTFSTSKLKMIEKLNDANSLIKKQDLDNSGDKAIFPLDSVFLKTGRAIETIYCKTYCDLFYIPLNVIDNSIIYNFPNEMQTLSIKARKIGSEKIGNDRGLLKVVNEHSSRSVGKYYEAEFNTKNMWIEIPIIIPKFKLKYFSILNFQDRLSNSSNLGLLDNNFHKTRNLLLKSLSKYKGIDI